MARGAHYDSPVESRPVFADPSGRRRKVLWFAGIGTMVALAAFLVAVLIALTGGPQAPLTQWAAPQAPPPSATLGGAHVVSGGNSRSGTPRASSGTGSGGATTPALSATSTLPTATRSAKPTLSATATASPTASPAHGHKHPNPHTSTSTPPAA